MEFEISKKKRKPNIKNILLWSIITAAFIGPGTITTAARSGASYGTSLLWAVIFATVACYILQESVARLTIITGNSLGEHLDLLFQKPFFKYFTALSVILGCAAYEAGNILGAVNGVELIFPFNKLYFIALIGLIGFVTLYSGRLTIISSILAFAVATMGISFIFIAVMVLDGISISIVDLLVPDMPKGSEFLTIALIGTTIVPYNIFLGSGGETNA